jgi:hypothetical protein
MKTKFERFLKIKELSMDHNLFFPENFGWVKEYIPFMPKIDIDMPMIVKKSKIHMIKYNTNPIVIQFEDKSKIFCSYDQYRRLPKKPEKGQMVEFGFMGSPDIEQTQPMVLKSFRVIS